MVLDITTTLLFTTGWPVVTLRGLSGGFAAYKLAKGGMGEGEERGKRKERERKRGDGVVAVGDDGIGHHHHVVLHEGVSYGHVEGSLG
jgi:hypothetical protein